MKPDPLVDIVDPVNIVPRLGFGQQRCFDFLQGLFADAAPVVDDLDHERVPPVEGTDSDDAIRFLIFKAVDDRVFNQGLQKELDYGLFFSSRGDPANEAEFTVVPDVLDVKIILYAVDLLFQR